MAIDWGKVFTGGGQPSASSGGINWGTVFADSKEPTYWSNARANNFDFGAIDRQKQKGLESVLMGIASQTSPYLGSSYKPGTISTNFPSNNVVNQNLGTWSGLRNATTESAPQIASGLSDVLFSNTKKLGRTVQLLDPLSRQIQVQATRPLLDKLGLSDKADNQMRLTQEEINKIQPKSFMTKDVEKKLNQKNKLKATGEFAKTIATGGVGVGSEVVPLVTGGSLAGMGIKEAGKQLAKGAVLSGATNIGSGFANGNYNNMSASDRAKAVAIDFGIGAGSEVGAYGVGRGANKLLKRGESSLINTLADQGTSKAIAQTMKKNDIFLGNSVAQQIAKTSDKKEIANILYTAGRKSDLANAVTPSANNVVNAVEGIQQKEGRDIASKLPKPIQSLLSAVGSAKNKAAYALVNNMQYIDNHFKGAIDTNTGRKVTEVVRELAGNVRQSAGLAQSRREQNEAFQQLGQLARGLEGRKGAARKTFKEDIVPFIQKKQDAINKRKLGENVPIPKGTAEQEQAYSLLNKSTKNEVQYAFDNGLIDGAKYKAWMADTDYTRVQREMEDTLSGGSSRAEASLNSTVTSQKLKGSSKEALNPIATYIDWSNKITREAEVNKLATYVTKQLENVGEGAITTEKNMSAKSLARFNNGVKELVETDPLVVKSIKDMDAVSFGAMNKYVNFPGRVLKAGATGYNPAFIVANYIKDQITSFNLSKNAFATHSPIAFWEGLKESAIKPTGRAVARKFGVDDAFKPSEMFQEYMKKNKNMTTADLARELKSATREGYEELGLKGNSFLRKAEDIMTSTETATRYQNFVGQYRKELKNGVEPEEALRRANQAARENSIDFSQRGELSGFMRIFNPYLPAQIQGSRTLARAFKERPVATSIKIGTTVLAPVSAAAYYNLSDPERAKLYAEIPEYERNSNLIMVLGGGRGYIKVPLPPGIQSMAKPLRNLIESEYLGDRQGFLETAKNLLVDPFNPLGSTKNEVMNNFIPQSIKPAVQVAVNKDLYTGNQIISDKLLENKKPADQYYESTSQSYRDIGKVLGVSPLQVRSLIKGYGAGGGEQLFENVDQARKLAGQDVATGGRSTLEQVLGRFYGAKPSTNAVESRFYTDLKATTLGKQDVSNAVTDAVKQGDYNRARTLVDQFNAKIDNLESVYKNSYGKYEGGSNLLEQLQKNKLKNTDKAFSSRKRNK